MVEYYPGWAAEAFGFPTSDLPFDGRSNAIGAGQTIPAKRGRPPKTAPRRPPRPARIPPVGTMPPMDRRPPAVTMAPSAAIPDWSTTTTPEPAQPAQPPQRVHTVGVGTDIFDPQALAGPEFESNRPSVVRPSVLRGDNVIEKGPPSTLKSIMDYLNSIRDTNIQNREERNNPLSARTINRFSPADMPPSLGGDMAPPEARPPQVDLSNTLGGDPESMMPQGGFGGEPELPSGISGIAQSIMMYLNDIRDRNIQNRENRRERSATSQRDPVGY